MAGGWTDGEVFKLIYIWKEEGIQEQLEGSKRNKHVYDKLGTQMCKAGYNKTGEQCRCKVKKLRQEYKKIKDNNGLTGRGRGKWKFFDALDEVLGNRPATCPPVVLDTTLDDPETEDQSASALDDAVNLSDGEEVSDDENSLPVSGLDTSNSSPAASASGSIASDDSESIKKKREKRKRKSKEEQLENVLTKVMKTVTDGMRETEKMLIEVEEKRLANEAQQRRKDSQFQLQLAQIFAGQPSSSPYHYPGYQSQFYQPHPITQPQQHGYYDANNEHEQ